MKTKELPNIGNKIRKLREFQNLTQEHIAIGLGISQQVYSRLEIDSSSLSVTQLVAVSDLLAVTPTTLLEEDAHQIIFNISNNHNKGDIISNGKNLGTIPEKKLYEELITQLKAENISLKTQVAFLQKLLDKTHENV